MTGTKNTIVEPGFSRRFMKWNATIIVTLFLSTRTDQNSSWKFYKVLFHQIALFGLTNWTKKVFPVFRVTYHTGREQRVPPFIFFGTARLFFWKKISPNGAPSIFCCFASEWMLENPKGSPLQFFSALWDFFPKIAIFSPFNYLMFCDRMDVEKNPQRVPLSVFRHCETLARQGLALAGLGAPLGPFFWVCNFSENFFSKNFRFSSTVKENTWHLEVFLLFLSLGYGADLGRSRLVSLPGRWSFSEKDERLGARTVSQKIKAN